MDCVRVLIAHNCPKEKGTTLQDLIKHAGQTDKSMMDSVKVDGPALSKKDNWEQYDTIYYLELPNVRDMPICSLCISHLYDQWMNCTIASRYSL